MPLSGNAFVGMSISSSRRCFHDQAVRIDAIALRMRAEREFLQLVRGMLGEHLAQRPFPFVVGRLLRGAEGAVEDDIAIGLDVAQHRRSE